MQEEPVDEGMLWLQFKNGDKDAFSRLYRLFSLPLIAYGYRLCPDNDLLKDQIQELFVELWNSRATLSYTNAVKFYPSALGCLDPAEEDRRPDAHGPE